MKRCFLLFLSLMFFLNIVACTGVPALESSTPDTTSMAPTEQPTPSPAPTPTPEPAPTPLTFVFDRYALPADLTEYLTETGLTAEWTRLVDAVFAGKTAVSQLDRGPAEDLSCVFTASPYAALAELTYQDGELAIAYTDAGTPESLEAAVTSLVENVLFEESNELETLLALYRTVSGFQYEEGDDNSLYRMLVEKRGGAKEFAAALQYLFAQSELHAYLAEGSAADLPHWWVIAEYGGSLYHFDPVFENSATAGKGLSFFGMSDTAHQTTGCSAVYTVGFDTHVSKAEDLCPQTTFDDLFIDVVVWQEDILLHQITVTFSGAPEYPMTVHTDTLRVG